MSVHGERFAEGAATLIVLAFVAAAIYSLWWVWLNHIAVYIALAHTVVALIGLVGVVYAVGWAVTDGYDFAAARARDWAVYLAGGGE